MYIGIPNNVRSSATLTADMRNEDVLCVVIKGDHPSYRKTMHNDSTVTDLAVKLCWRLGLLRLGDALQKLGLVAWETKIPKFGHNGGNDCTSWLKNSPRSATRLCIAMYN